MATSKMEKLIAMLKRHEGVETHAYECSEGRITVACGRNIDQRGGLASPLMKLNTFLRTILQE